MKYIRLFEDWNDSFEIPQSISQALTNAQMNLVRIFGLGGKNLYANAEEMKEIEKVKQYYKWWYSDPKVISKLNVKGDKNSVANRIVEYIDRKLVPSEFRIFRNEEDAKKYLKIAYNDENFYDSDLGWAEHDDGLICIRLHLIKSNGYTLFGTVLHEVAHSIQMFASEKLKAELYNPILPKGAYGTDSIKYGLFLPPLDSNRHNKPYAEREIEQFARFHVMRYYFGIKPNDSCNVICDKIKKNIAKRNNTNLYLMERENGEKYLLFRFSDTKNKAMDSDLDSYMESLGFRTHYRGVKKAAIEKNKSLSDMEWEKLWEFTYLLDLDTICHDHQNIVSNLDIDEKNLA